MEEEDLFDEFGNYIGPEIVAQPEQFDYREEAEEQSASLDHQFAMVTVGDGNHIYGLLLTFVEQQIVLHEDKQYYPSAEEVYGRKVEVLVQEEDTQHLSQPVIEPIKEKRFQYLERTIPERTYSDVFLRQLMDTPSRVRNVMVAGALHHGKTALVDLLVLATHYGQSISDEKGTLKYLDNLMLEKDRKISLKAKPISIVHPDAKGTSYLLNLIDTPGHSDFLDQVQVACRYTEGMIIVVDAVEGLTLACEKIICLAVQHGLSIVLVINKVERLMLELRLPPTDAFFKLRHTIEGINTFLKSVGSDHILSPELGNVLFASTLAGWIFSLESFALSYAYRSRHRIDPAELSKRLWGDIYLDVSTGQFRRTASATASKRTFVTFLLEPMYKLYSHILSEDRPVLEETLGELGIRLTSQEYNMNTRPIIALVMQKLLGPLTCLVDTLRDHVDPFDRHQSLIIPESELNALGFAGLSYPNRTATSLDVLVKVERGELHVGQTLFGIAINEGSLQLVPGEQPPRVQITGLYVPCGRYFIPVNSVPMGSWALISGADISKASLLTDSSNPVVAFKSLVLPEVVFKVALEPVNPSDLPKMLDGLRKLAKAYPALETKVEESGEHILMGIGELYLDCALHDLRRLYAQVDVKLSDPIVKFAETVLETSFLKCYSDTPNGRNKLTMIAEPLERGLAEAIEKDEFGRSDAKSLSCRLQTDFGWDILAARSLWAFGPDSMRGPNVLLDDTLPVEVDKDSLALVRDPLVQGFQWAVREGPLCEEPIRSTKFRIVDALIAAEPIHRGAGQLIPTTRKVCYSSFLTASPRLMEPVNLVEIQTAKDCVDVVYQVLAKRRGHVISETAKAGSPMYVIRALLPVLDSCGFETDLRTSTIGAALPVQTFDHWQVVPGDPLDTSVRLVPLEPAPAPHLARDLLLKTRRRKGLSPDLSVARFFDDPMLVELAREQATAGIGSLRL